MLKNDTSDETHGQKFDHVELTPLLPQAMVNVKEIDSCLVVGKLCISSLHVANLGSLIPHMNLNFLNFIVDGKHDKIVFLLFH